MTPASGLEVPAARFVLGWFDSFELAAVAQALVVDGYESPSLLLLAGTYPQDLPWEGHELLERSLRELGEPLPSRQEACLVFARDYARRLLDGELTPDGAAKAILALTYELSTPDALLDVGYLTYELEDHPDYRKEIEQDILDGARRLLAATESGEQA